MARHSSGVLPRNNSASVKPDAALPNGSLTVQPPLTGIGRFLSIPLSVRALPAVAKIDDFDLVTGLPISQHIGRDNEAPRSRHSSTWRVARKVRELLACRFDPIQQPICR